jgi:hypothetical protein
LAGAGTGFDWQVSREMCRTFRGGSIMRGEALRHWALLLVGTLLLSVAIVPSGWLALTRAAWSMVQGIVAR